MDRKRRAIYTVNDLLQVLQSTRRELLVKELESASGVSSTHFSALYRKLESHPQVSYNKATKRYRCKARFGNVHDKDQLLKYMRQCGQGLAHKNLVQPTPIYPGVENDLKLLVDQKDVFVIQNTKSPGNKNVYFPLPLKQVHVDDAFRKLWSGVMIPHSETEIDKELFGAEFRQKGAVGRVREAASRRRKAESESQKPKTKRRRWNRRSAANDHMLEKLPWLKDI